MVQETGFRRVGMLPDIHREFLRLDERWKRKLDNHFQNYGVPGTTMPREHYNFEGRYPTGGKQSKDIAVWAFKAFQQRIYGVVVEIDGKATFSGMAMDQKKKNNADQRKLRNVARAFGEYLK